MTVYLLCFVLFGLGVYCMLVKRNIIKIIVGSIIGIFLLTALFGRVWCGWACPQTVYMEFVQNVGPATNKTPWRARDRPV